MRHLVSHNPATNINQDATYGSHRSLCTHTHMYMSMLTFTVMSDDFLRLVVGISTKRKLDDIEDE